MKTPIAIFASGSGSNFQSLVDAVEAGNLQADIRLLVCDRPAAYVLQRARANGTVTLVRPKEQYANKATFEEAILHDLHQYGVQWLVLAGYMRIIGATLLQSFPGKIVNIHPSLLPDFPGKDAIGQALRANVSQTGVTVHEVDAGIDTGPIIAQTPVPIFAGDTRGTLTKRIQATEHTFYPRTLATHIAQKEGDYDDDSTRTR